jgi:hypothetical protein
VSFAGELSDGALAAVYARAHALIIPSFHEGFCVPVVEALSAGCFVIATDAGNLPELVGKFGAIVPAGDIAALGAALGAFCESVDRGHFPTARFVEEAVRFAAGFSYDEFGAQFRAHVARLLTNTAPGETGDDEPIGVSPAAERLAAVEKSFERRRMFSAAARNSIAAGEMAPHRLGALLRTRDGPRHLRDE